MEEAAPTNDEAAPEGMGQAVYEQILQLWVEPEIERRGTTLDSLAIRQALVVMPPEEPVEVLIDSEAEIIADVVAARPIAEGQPVTLDDIQQLRGLRPKSVDPDAGWVLFAWVGPTIYVAFDLRRNRKRAQRLLSQAEEFADVARRAADQGWVKPVIVNAYVAAELAVKANMLVHATTTRRSHNARRSWIAQWGQLGNVSQTHSSTLGRLAGLQNGARYGDKEIDISDSELSQLLAGVRDIISDTAAAVGAES